MRKRIGSCAVPVLAVLLLTACPQDDADRAATTRQPAQQEPGATAPPALDPQVAGELPPGVTTEMVASGQQLYGTVCVACHGPAGTGTPLGPALNDQNWIHIGGSLEEILQITQAGVARPQEYPAPMPPMGGGSYNQEQLQAIAAYVYALSRGQI
jgi:mono/diheme cytochrome c family protein